MTKNSEIIVSILILVAIVLALWFFHLGPFNKTEICPPDKCQLYETDADGNPIGVTFPKEAGRLEKYFIGTPPPGLPADMPISPKPLLILKSYVETVRANEEKGDLAHTQIFYSYVTTASVLATSNSFERYLRNNDYDVAVNKDNSSKQIYNISGSKTLAQKEYLVNIMTANQNQFENIVSVSFITSDKSKSQ